MYYGRCPNCQRVVKILGHDDDCIDLDDYELEQRLGELYYLDEKD